MDNEFTREEVLTRLNAICREITCMGNTRFAEKIKDGEMVFDRLNWGKEENVQVKIKITKTKVNNE
jgi:hypothetical protein